MVNLAAAIVVIVQYYDHKIVGTEVYHGPYLLLFRFYIMYDF